MHNITPIIVQRNNIRDKLNTVMLTHSAARSGTTLYTFHSEDTSVATHKPLLPPVQAWVDRYITFAQTDKLARVMSLHKGAEITLEENIAPELGFANGANFFIHDILPDERDKTSADATYTEMKLTYLPAAILIKVPLMEDTVFAPGLPPGVFSLKKRSHKATVTANGNSIVFTRTMFAIHPARCMTDYKSQGKGFPRAVLDIKAPLTSRPDYVLAVYVMLGRVAELDGIGILRPFDASLLTKPFPLEIKEEVQRLEALSAAHAAAFWTRNRRDKWDWAKGQVQNRRNRTRR